MTPEGVFLIAGRPSVLPLARPATVVAAAMQRPVAAAVLDHLSDRDWTPFMLRRLIHNAFRIGTAENATRVIKVATDPGIPDIVRKEALRLLATWTEPFPVDQLTGYWRPLEKRSADSVVPALMAAMPTLLAQNDFALTAALGLIKTYQLQIPDLDGDKLGAMVRNTALPDEARAAALDLFLHRNPENAKAFLIGLTNDSSDEVVLGALTAISKLAPETAVPLLENALNSGSPSRVRKTWAVMGTMQGKLVDDIFVNKLAELRAANGISPSALELMDAAKQRKSQPVNTALKALEKSLTQNPDALAKWNPAIQGGDVAAGAAIFASHPASECMRCHRSEEGHAAGGETAPNLAGIANRHQDPRYFLESMINPSAVIAPGFGAVLIDFKNGASLSGNVLAETPDHIDIDAAGKSLRVSRADVATVTAPTSPMPPMGTLLKPAEIRDIIAWLTSLKQGSAPPKNTSTPSPLDPATLLASAGKSPAPPTGIDPAVMTSGHAQFLMCGACHGQQGEGTPIAPPLAGSEWVTGPEENLIRIQLRGLTGPIKVKGREYNMPAGMAPLAYQTDEQIAAVLTYVRNSFGNSAPAVTPAAVTALRGEVGKPQLTAADLTPPEAAKPKKPEEGGDMAAPPADATPAAGKYDHLSTEPSRYNNWIALAIGLFVVGTIAGAFRFMKK